MPVATVSVTCVLDSRAHEVTDVELATGGGGTYRALCGHVIQAAAMVAPDGAPCPECAALRPRVLGLEQPAKRRPWQRWLLRMAG